MKFIRCWFNLGVIMSILLAVGIIALQIYINKSTKEHIYTQIEQLSPSYTGLVLGAKVYKNGLSSVLQDRIDSALDLYKAHKIKRFLLSGDHGKINYDEVNQMKKYLIKKGVPSTDIFLDHAGFNTYSSIYRARNIFKASDVIIITQKFHLKRALFIAKALDVKSQGFVADKHNMDLLEKCFYAKVWRMLKLQ